MQEERNRLLFDLVGFVEVGLCFLFVAAVEDDKELLVLVDEKTLEQPLLEATEVNLATVFEDEHEEESYITLGDWNDGAVQGAQKVGADG